MLWFCDLTCWVLFECFTGVLGGVVWGLVVCGAGVPVALVGWIDAGCVSVGL